MAPAPTAEPEALSDDSEEDDHSPTPPRATAPPATPKYANKENVAALRQTPSKRQPPVRRVVSTKETPTKAAEATQQGDWETTSKAAARGRTTRRVAANAVVDATATVVPAGELSVTLVGGRRLQQVPVIQ